jgi:RNA-directed DNA polymerase
MGLSLNEDKTRKLDARTDNFSFLGFTIRYDKDIKGRDFRYWNIVPSKKSEQKIRDKVIEYLGKHGHCRAHEVAYGLNSILRGWLNYFSINGVSYPAMSKRRLRAYLFYSLYRYYNRKSQRKSRLYGHMAFEILTAKFGLIDPSKFVYPLARL